MYVHREGRIKYVLYFEKKNQTKKKNGMPMAQERSWKMKFKFFWGRLSICYATLLWNVIYYVILGEIYQFEIVGISPLPAGM